MITQVVTLALDPRDAGPKRRTFHPQTTVQIQLRIERDGAVHRCCKTDGAITIGRRAGDASVDVDLADDLSVSRLHARIWYDDGRYWIEDTSSRSGTWVDGENIRGSGAKCLGFERPVRIGRATIELEKAEPLTREALNPDQAGVADPPPENVQEAALAADTPPPESNLADEALGLTLVERVDAAHSGVIEADARSTALERQLDLLCDLALKLGAEPHLNRALHLAVEQTVRIIPNAARGALLLVERGSGRLMLKAHLPPDYRPSERLARQAIEKREGFTWVVTKAMELSDSGAAGNGMCVPLFAGGEAIGVLCIDAPESRGFFTEADLRVLRAIGQFVSMAVQQHQSLAALAAQSEFTNRLFSSRFPESVRRNLLVEAAAGTLALGTRRSLVTVLQSDIRGFTKLSEELGPQRLSDLLNAYFPPLIQAVFEFGGSVERTVGDAIFAVFGSPEPDPEQQEHAVCAALAMQQAVAEVSAFRRKRKQATCGIGIGIDCSEVLHGFIGDAESIEFAVMGDAANYSSRYCTGAQPGEILISPNVHAHVWKRVNSEVRMLTTKHEGEIEAHVVKGLRARTEPSKPVA